MFIIVAFDGEEMSQGYAHPFPCKQANKVRFRSLSFAQRESAIVVVTTSLYGIRQISSRV